MLPEIDNKLKQCMDSMNGWDLVYFTKTWPIINKPEKFISNNMCIFQVTGINSVYPDTIEKMEQIINTINKNDISNDIINMNKMHRAYIWIYVWDMYVAPYIRAYGSNGKIPVDICVRNFCAAHSNCSQWKLIFFLIEMTFNTVGTPIFIKI